MSAYLALLRRPGALAFVTAGFVGRLPISMVNLGIVLLITSLGGSYALAGAMAATHALASAFIAPLGARWIDRAGQSKAAPILVVVQVTSLSTFAVAADRGAAAPVLFGLLVAAGGAAPNVGSLVRARWAAAVSGGPAIASAFALEAVIDEMVFVVGPPLMTVLALQVGELFGLAVCVVLILVGVLWLSAQRATQPAPRPPRHGHAPEPLWGVPLVVVIAMMILMGGIFGAFEVTTVAFTASLDHEELTGVVLALYAFGSLLAGLAYGTARIATGLEKQLLWFSVLLAVVTVPLAFVHHIVPLAAGAFLAGLSVSPLLIATTTVVERVVPAGRLTEALGITTSGIAVGLAIGATGSGALIDSVGANGGYALMAGCGVLTLLVAAGTFPAMRRALLV